MAKRITVRDIASACSVSVGLVSKALKNQEGVGEETRQKIVEMAHSLGYDFDRLKEPTIERVAVFMLEDHDLAFALPFFSLVLAGIDDICKAKRLGMSFSTIGQHDDINKAIAAANCQAAIFIGYIPKHMRDMIPSINYPCASVDSDLNGAVSFNVNNFELAYELTSHVIAQGVTELAFLLPLRDHYSICERERGFMQALYDHNLSLDPNYEFKSSALGRKAEEIAADLDQLFSLKRPPQAIICYNDLIAIEVLKACNKFKLQVPKDVIVTGFDDIDLISFTNPPLTSAKVDGRRMGQAAVEALLNKLSPSNYIIKGEVKIRASSLRTSV